MIYCVRLLNRTALTPTRKPLDQKKLINWQKIAGKKQSLTTCLIFGTCNIKIISSSKVIYKLHIFVL
jgi:hypothetical protein